MLDMNMNFDISTMLKS